MFPRRNPSHLRCSLPARVSRFYQSCFPPPPPYSPPTASDLNCEFGSQRALPDLNRELYMSVGTAGPQQRAADLMGHCRTSTTSSTCLWPLPTSIADARSQWALPSRAQWALPDLSQTPERSQIECQKEC